MLRNFKESFDIVIKKADKGSPVVVWGLEEYRKEAYCHLKDENAYEKVLGNPINKVIALIDGKLQNYAVDGTISQANLKYLKGESLNLGRFYLLPKIHKSLVEVQVGQLCLTVGCLQKGYQNLWIIILIP